MSLSRMHYKNMTHWVTSVDSYGAGLFGASSFVKILCSCVVLPRKLDMPVDDVDCMTCLIIKARYKDDR